METYFETTFGISHGEVLHSMFLPSDTANNLWVDYVTLMWFRCDVHSKRVLLEKTDTDKVSPRYFEAIGMRKVNYEYQMVNSMNTTNYCGGKKMHF